MPFCLEREEFEKLIAIEIEKCDLEGDESLELRIEHAKNWFDALIGFAYFLSKIFEKKLKQEKTIEILIKELDQVYVIQDTMWFVIEEFDQDFIKYLLNSERIPMLSLEDELVDARNKLSRFEYG